MGSVNDDIITLLNIYYFRSDGINFLGVSVRSPIWLCNYRFRKSGICPVFAHWSHNKLLKAKVIVTDRFGGGNHQFRHFQWTANDVRKAESR